MFKTGPLKWRLTPLRKSAESQVKEISFELDNQEPIVEITQAQKESVDELSQSFKNMNLRKFSRYSRINSGKRSTYFLSYGNKRTYKTPTLTRKNGCLQTPDNLKTRKRYACETSGDLSFLSSSKRSYKTPCLIDSENIVSKIDTTLENSLITKKPRSSRLKKNSLKIKPRDLFGTKEAKKRRNNENQQRFDKDFNDSGISLNESPTFSKGNLTRSEKRKPVKILKRRHNNEQSSSSPKEGNEVNLKYEKRSRFLGVDLNLD